MIYVIEAAEVSRVKVGFTANDPMDRLYQMQVGSPVLLSLRMVADGTLQQESQLHNILAPHRFHREWFADGPHIAAAIAKLPTLAPQPSAMITVGGRKYPAPLNRKRRMFADVKRLDPRTAAPTDVLCAYCGVPAGQPCVVIQARWGHVRGDTRAPHPSRHRAIHNLKRSQA